MKILSIRIKNLASLAGEHFIDFETEPLANAGLVAIVGKTGAGKSTILDAMCLALFNRVPRLKDSDGKLVDVDGSELLTNSPQTVLRRGTGHGFAELNFTAQDQKVYSARWEIKRARENPNGKLQSVQRSLKCLTDGIVIADKTKAVENQILRITQLSFEQFTRAVLLAQSEVTVFLKARDNERGELLEYLTNSSIFGKIGQLAFEKTKEVANDRKKLEQASGLVQEDMLSEDQIEDLNQQLSEVIKHYQKLDAEKELLKKYEQWFKRHEELNHSIQAKQQHYDTQLQAQAVLSSQKQSLAQLDIFAEIRPTLTQKQQLDQDLLQLENHIQTQQQIFASVSRDFSTQETQYRQADKALTEIQNFEQRYHVELNELGQCISLRKSIGEEFTALKNKVEDLNKKLTPQIEQTNLQKQAVEASIQQLQQIHTKLEQHPEFKILDSGITVYVQNLKQFIDQYQNIEQQVGSLQNVQTQLTQQQAELAHLKAQYGTTVQIHDKLAQLRPTSEQHQQCHNSTVQWLQNFGLYVQLNTQLQQDNQELDKSKLLQNELREKSQHTEQQYHLSKNEVSQLQNILQQQQLLHTENVEHLRAELQPDQPCIVCGSLEHPYADNSELVSKALFELQEQQLKQAEEKQKISFEEWQSALAASTKIASDIEQRTLHQQQQLTVLNKQKKDLVTQAKQLKLNINFEQDNKLIESEVQQTLLSSQQNIDLNKDKITKLENASKNQQQAEQQIQSWQYHLKTADQLQQLIQPILQCLNAQVLQQWQNAPLDSAKHVLSDLELRATYLSQFNVLTQKIEQQTNQLQSFEKDLEHLKGNITEHEATLKQIEQKGHDNKEHAKLLIQKMTGLVDSIPHEWLNKHEQQRLQCQQQYNALKQQFEKIRVEYETQRNSLEHLKNTQLKNQATVLGLTQQIKMWLEQHSNFNLELLHELSQISSAQEQQMRATIQQNEKSLAKADSALKTMQEQLTQHLFTKPEIEILEIQRDIQLNLEALNAQQELRDKLKMRLELHQRNIDKQKQFADQITSIQIEEHRWNKISSLMGDSTGKKFRDIAQQYNLDILLEYANQQLAMLSQRYTLKRLDNSLSLAIVDHDMDGETRSVSSLSGGESFLTALALSLAIANMASGSMKIESLFIDEGFGTLDASSLHMVMNALDQLQSQGRKVVLISHIQEMHERIPVQIQVKPVGAGASTIEVVG